MRWGGTQRRHRNAGVAETHNCFNAQRRFEWDTNTGLLGGPFAEWPLRFDVVYLPQLLLFVRCPAASKHCCRWAPFRLSYWWNYHTHCWSVEWQARLSLWKEEHMVFYGLNPCFSHLPWHFHHNTMVPSRVPARWSHLVLYTTLNI